MSLGERAISMERRICPNYILGVIWWLGRRGRRGSSIDCNTATRRGFLFGGLYRRFGRY
jgi:hypothetical protein